MVGPAKSKPLSKEVLISQGKCCGNGCVNCPYYPKHQRGSTEVFKMPDSVSCYPACNGITMQDGECLCYLDYKDRERGT